MKNLKEREEVIEYSIKLNTTNLSPLRSGNISVRGIEDGVEGFFITPSGKKYESLKTEDIVFLSLTEEKDFLSWFNSAKILHQSGDFTRIFIKINGKQKLLFMLIHLMLLQYQLMVNQFHHFTT